MTDILPQRVLIVVNCPKPPVGEALAHAFARRGVEARIFYSQFCNTYFDRFVIHNLNHYAHVLRLVPKHVDLFEGHPKSHKVHRNREFLELCREFRPDLVFLTRGLRFTLETLAALKEMTTVFCWFTESEKRVGEIVPEIPHYHRTYFFSTVSLETARGLGFRDVSLLQHAVDTDQFYPMDLPRRYDWCFVGQWHARRQQYIEGLAEVSRNFVIYGPRWLKRLWRRPALWLKVRGTGIWGEPLTRLYNQTKVVINVSVWAQEQQTGAGVNLRLLEVPACRTCLLTDLTSDAERLLTPDVHFVGATTLPEM
jgi:spore maturation protein CgeB